MKGWGAPVCISVSKMADFAGCASGTFSHRVRGVGGAKPKAIRGRGHFLFHLIRSLTDPQVTHTCLGKIASRGCAW